MKHLIDYILTMVDLQQLKEKLSEFRNMNDRDAYQVADSYLLRVMDITSRDQAEQKWQSSFDEMKTDFSEADSLLKSAIENKESIALVRIGVETMLESSPDTQAYFIEAVNKVSKKEVQFGVEIVLLSIAAATLIREYYKKGKAHETFIEEGTDEKGKKYKITRTTKYASDGPLAGLLTKIWGKIHG
jgi:hypothetical protein